MPASQGILIPHRVSERAFTKWEPSPSGCYISTYSVASHGYAQIGWQEADGKRRGTTAHRAAWTHVHGQIPEGITIDHEPTCDHRCVNTDHLRKLTNFENGRRTHGRDWPLGECARGHSNDFLVEEWVKRLGRKRLRCSECRKEDRLASQRQQRKDPVKYAKVLAQNREGVKRRAREKLEQLQ